MNKKLKYNTGGMTPGTQRDLSQVLGVVSSVAPMFGPIGIGVGVAAGLGSNFLGKKYEENVRAPHMASFQGYRDGGMLPLSNNAQEVVTNPNKVDAYFDPTRGVRLDDAEVIKSDFVFSNRVVNPITNRTFAKDAKRVEMKTGMAEKKNEIYGDTISKNTVSFNNQISGGLASLQEQVATSMGMRDSAPRGYTKGGPIDPPYMRTMRTATDGIYYDPFSDTFVKRSSQTGKYTPALLSPSDKEAIRPTPEAVQVHRTTYARTPVPNNVPQFPIPGLPINSNLNRPLVESNIPQFPISGLPINQNLDAPPSPIPNLLNFGFGDNPAVQSQVEQPAINTPQPVPNPTAVTSRPVTSARPTTRTQPQGTPPALAQDPVGPFNIPDQEGGRSYAAYPRNIDPLPLPLPGLGGVQSQTNPVVDVRNNLANYKTPTTGAEGVTPKAGLGTGFTTGDYMQLGAGLSRLAFFQSPEVERQYNDNTDITKQSYDVNPVLAANNTNFQNSVNNTETYSPNLRRAVMNQLYAKKLAQDGQTIGQYQTMNNQAVTDYENRLSNQTRYNNQQTIGTNDINARNRAAARQSQFAAFDQLGTFGVMLNQKKSNAAYIEALKLRYPDVSTNVLNSLLNGQ
jgi:hypothetical protein